MYSSYFRRSLKHILTFHEEVCFIGELSWVQKMVHELVEVVEQIAFPSWSSVFQEPKKFVIQFVTCLYPLIGGREKDIQNSTHRKVIAFEYFQFFLVKASTFHHGNLREPIQGTVMLNPLVRPEWHSGLGAMISPSLSPLAIGIYTPEN